MKHIAILCAVAITVFASSGQQAYKVCVGCHGKRGEKSAVGVSKKIGGQKAALTVKQLKAYRAGALNQYGMGNLMNKYAKRLSDKEIEALARYIASM